MGWVPARQGAPNDRGQVLWRQIGDQPQDGLRQGLQHGCPWQRCFSPVPGRVRKHRENTYGDFSSKKGEDGATSQQTYHHSPWQCPPMSFRLAQGMATAVSRRPWAVDLTSSEWFTRWNLGLPFTSLSGFTGPSKPGHFKPGGFQ